MGHRNRKTVVDSSGKHETPTTLVFSPDGDTLIGAGPPQEIWWWDLRSIKLRAAFRIDGPISEIMTFSPDGTTLATVDQDNAIRLWDAVDVKLLSTLIGGEHSVEAIAFSPDGNLLASGGWDDLLLWDLRRSRRLAIFQEAHSPIQTLAFSPDGRTLVSGSVDSKVQLWDTATAFHLVTLRGHTEAINAVAFSRMAKPSPAGVPTAQFCYGIQKFAQVDNRWLKNILSCKYSHTGTPLVRCPDHVAFRINWVRDPFAII